jgi:hypothetical protein
MNTFIKLSLLSIVFLCAQPSKASQHSFAEFSSQYVTLPANALPKSAYADSLRNAPISKLLGASVPTQAMAEQHGWNFSEHNTFSKGEIVLTHLYKDNKRKDLNNPDNIHYELSVIDNPSGDKFRAHTVRGPTTIKSIGYGKFGKSGIFLAGSPKPFCAKEIEEMVVSLPAGALPEPALSPDLIEVPACTILGAQISTDEKAFVGNWARSSTFARGEITGVVLIDSINPKVRYLEMALILQTHANKGYFVQLGNGVILAAFDGYLYKHGYNGVLTQKKQK